MTIKDKDGKEWVLVPVEAGPAICDAILSAVKARHASGWSIYAAALAAVPQFVPPAVTDEVDAAPAKAGVK